MSRKKLLLLAGAALVAPGMVSKRRARAELRQKVPTVIATIKRGEVDALRAIFAEIEESLRRGETRTRWIDYSSDEVSHFSKFIILPPTPEHPAERLMWSANFNGTLEDYIAEVVRVSPGLDDIWGKVEGYESRANFLDFVNANNHKAGVVYVGFPYTQVKEIRENREIRRRVQDVADVNQVGEVPSEVRSLADALAGKRQEPIALMRFLERLHHGRLEMVQAFKDRIFIPMVKKSAGWYAGIGMPKTFSKVPKTCEDLDKTKAYFEHLDAIQETEDFYVMNEMTFMARIDPKRLLRLQLAVVGSPAFTTYAYPPGNFAQVFTLHGFSFLIIDDGKYLVFHAYFDGSSKNYLSDFLDKLIWGLNTYYNNCEEFPPAGMQEVDSFVQWIFERQIPHSVFYTAYPDMSVLGISRDKELADTIGTNFNPDAAEKWFVAV